MADYWEARKAREMYEYMEDAEKVAAELKQLYDNASLVIIEDIDKIFKRFANRFKLSEEEARRILEAAGTDINAVLRHMNNSAKSEGVKETLAEIDAPAYRYRINNLEEKQQQIDLMVSNLRQQEQAKTTNLYKKLAEKVYNHSMFDIQQMYGLGFSFTALDEKVIDKLLKSKWSGANYSKRIWKNTDKLAQTLKEELLVSMLTGRTDTRTAEAIQERMQVGAYESRRLVRTESCYISKEMEMAAYDECGIDTYIFLATLDMRTSETCQKLDKQQFKVSEQRTGVNAPPMHPFCRSTIISGASEDNLKNMKRRAFNPETGKTEVVPGDMTYQEWKKVFVYGDKSGLQELVPDDENAIADFADLRKQFKTFYEGIPKTWKDLPEGANVLNLNPDKNIENCVSCCIAYEMRMRKKAVIASKAIKSLQLNPFSGWENPEIISADIADAVGSITKQMSEWGEGARSQIVFKWHRKRHGIYSIKTNDTGHSIVAIQEGNHTVFIDIQKGKEYNKNEISKILEFADKSTIQYCRIDNLEINDRGVTACRKESL